MFEKERERAGGREPGRAAWRKEDRTAVPLFRQSRERVRVQRGWREREAKEEMERKGEGDNFNLKSLLFYVYLWNNACPLQNTRSGR